MSQTVQVPPASGQFSVQPSASTRPGSTVSRYDRLSLLQCLHELMSSSHLLADEWHALEENHREWIMSAVDQNDLIDRLAHKHLLTEYQATRVKSGNVYGMVLGNYR